MKITEWSVWFAESIPFVEPTWGRHLWGSGQGPNRPWAKPTGDRYLNLITSTRHYIIVHETVFRTSSDSLHESETGERQVGCSLYCSVARLSVGCHYSQTQSQEESDCQCQTQSLSETLTNVLLTVISSVIMVFSHQSKTTTRQMLNLCIPIMPFTPGVSDLV